MPRGSTAELSNRPPLLKHVIVSVCLILLIAGIQVHGLWQSHHEVEERTKLTAQNLGRVLATSMADAFQNIDLTLSTAVEMTRLRPQGGDISDQAITDAMEGLVRRTPGLLGVHVTDASGKVMYGTGKRSIENVTIADRSYFQQLRDDPAAGMVVSPPLMGLIIKRWVLVCARRINLPNGQFAGVAYASIEIEGMAERVTGKPLQLGSRDIFAMSENDMNLIVRYVNGHQDMRFVGQRRSVPSVDALLRSGVDDGFFFTNSPFDQVERVFYFERIAGQPMNVIVGLATDEALAGWRREAFYGGITTLIFALLVSFGSYQIYRGQRQTLRLVVELAESNRSLANLSTTDSLTGIANRRRFDQLLEEEWRRGARNGQSVAVAMLDIDYFKAYNDRYGHQKGDDCLRQVGQLLGHSIHRAGDFVARYGGEEFVIVCAATDGEHAQRLVENIRTSLEKLAMMHELSPFGHVTVSIGVSATMPAGNQGAEGLLKRADEALYAAKKKGRNQVVLADAAPV